MTAGVRQVHADFAAAFAAVQKVEYDPTDCAESRWAGDHGRFQTALRDLERRLSHLVVVVSPYQRQLGAAHGFLLRKLLPVIMMVPS